MTNLKRLILSVLSLLPIPSISFAATESISIDTPRITQRGTRLADMYDAQFFSPSFYEKMNSIGILKGSDLYEIRNEQLRQFIRDAVRAEVVEAGHAGSPSPQ